MFTSIARLDASPAQTSRVRQLERWVSAKIQGFTKDTIFPVACVALSNSFADYEWVREHSSTHVKSGFANGSKVDLAKTADTRAKTKAEAEAELKRLGDQISEQIKGPFTWTMGVWATEAASKCAEVTAAFTPPSTAPEAVGIQPTATIGLTTSKTKKSPKTKREKVEATKKPKATATKTTVKKLKTVKPPKVTPVKIDRAGNGEVKAAPTFLGVALPASNSEHARRKFRNDLKAALGSAMATIVGGVEMSAACKGKGSNETAVYTIVI